MVIWAKYWMQCLCVPTKTKPDSGCVHVHGTQHTAHAECLDSKDVVRCVKWLVQGIIEGWIEDGTAPSFAKFVNEDAKKAKRRLKKAMKEEKEAEAYAKELGVVPGDDHSLERYTFAQCAAVKYS